MSKLGDDGDIGIRLKYVREKQNLSQRELGRRSDVPSATISLIESGKVSPSVSSLKRILEAIPMSLGEFFSFDQPKQPQFFFRAEDLVEIGQGLISFRQIMPHIPNCQLQIMHERYAPGADTGQKPLRHEGQEGGIVIKGQLEVTVNGISRLLKIGDAYFFESQSPHRFHNPFHEPCEIVSACTPPSF